MSNEEFLRRLEAALKDRLPPEELADVMDYHREYFAEAGEEAAGDLDTPEVIAHRIVEEHLSEQPPKELTRRYRSRLALTVLGIVLIGGLAAVLVHFGTKLVFENVFTGAEAERSETARIDSVLIQGTADEVTQVDDTTQVVETEFRKLVIDVPCADVTIAAGDGGIQTTAPQGFQLRDELKKGVLTYTGTAPKDVRITDERPQITIFLSPDQLRLDELDIEVEMGDVHLEGITASKIDAETENGNVTVQGCAATGEAVFSAKLGMVDVSGDFSCNIELDSEMGAIIAVLTGDRSNYGLELSTDWGEITVNEEAVGREHIVHNGPYFLSAECDTGDITVRFAD